MIPRTITQKIENIIQSNQSKKVIVIYGARQVGKTTLVQLIAKKNPINSVYYNCDYLDVQDSFSYKNSHNFSSLVKNLKLLILDEAQRIENIGMVLKILIDNFPDLQIIATGSSSFDLSNKINEPLTGRKIVFQLFPITFEECCSSLNPIEQQRKVDNLLRFGSYPNVLNQSDDQARKNIEEIANSYLFKDIFTFQQLKKPELLTKLLRLLAFQIGHEVSYHEIAQQLGIDQSIVQKYIYLLEEAFIIFRLSAFKRNLRSEVNKSRKIYFYDLGIRNALIQNFNSLDLRDDIGQLWENFCIAERLKFNSNHQQFVNQYFWRTYTKKEIDYIEEINGKLFAYEIKWNHKTQPKLPSEFLNTYSNSTFTLVNKTNFFTFISKIYS